MLLQLQSDMWIPIPIFSTERPSNRKFGTSHGFLPISLYFFQLYKAQSLTFFAFWGLESLHGMVESYSTSHFYWSAHENNIKRGEQSYWSFCSFEQDYRWLLPMNECYLEGTERINYETWAEFFYSQTHISRKELIVLNFLKLNNLSRHFHKTHVGQHHTT